MKVTSTVKHDLKFQVESYWGTEGGMDMEDFGPRCGTIEAALHQLELARSADPDTDWNITIYCTTEVGL